MDTPEHVYDKPVDEKRERGTCIASPSNVHESWGDGIRTASRSRGVGKPELTTVEDAEEHGTLPEVDDARRALVLAAVDPA